MLMALPKAKNRWPVYQKLDRYSLSLRNLLVLGMTAMRSFQMSTANVAEARKNVCWRENVFGIPDSGQKIEHFVSDGICAI